MELVLVRHAESIWNAENRWQGQTDVPLSEQGRGEAARLAARLAGERFDALVCSDLSRARETAEAVRSARRARGLREELVTRRGLREMDLGSWCGLPHADVLARFPEELEALGRGDDRVIGGTGESLPRFEERVHEALSEVLTEHASAERVLVVLHGGCIRAVLMRLLALRGRRRPLEGAGNTSITTLRVEGDAIRALVSYNDALHLEAPTRSHEGVPAPEGSSEHETVLGVAGRARVIELLGVPDEALLEAPAADAMTVVMPGARRIARYAVRRAP